MREQWRLALWGFNGLCGVFWIWVARNDGDVIKTGEGGGGATAALMTAVKSMTAHQTTVDEKVQDGRVLEFQVDMSGMNRLMIDDIALQPATQGSSHVHMMEVISVVNTNTDETCVSTVRHFSRL